MPARCASRPQEGRKVGFLRQLRVPASVRSRLARDERILAWARAEPDQVVVTNLGVWLPGRTDRLGWHQVHKATWRDSRLTIVPSVQVGQGDGYTVMADDAAVSVGLSRPGDVPAAIRTRVTRS